MWVVWWNVCYLSVNSQLYLTQWIFSIITTGRDVFSFFLKEAALFYGNAEGEVVNASVPSERSPPVMMFIYVYTLLF